MPVVAHTLLNVSSVGYHAGDNQTTTALKLTMIQKLQTRRGGFTLVEIMIVVAIIALLAAIAVPNFLRARKRSQATRVLEDLRMIDSATDQYAIENNKTSGMNPAWTDLKNYLKVGSVLYSTGADIFGDSYGPTFSVDTLPVIPATAYTNLSDVAPLSFWSPYHN
jgi:prepilin-type N-terminal cleavage/methylation domain-containing protein